MENIIELGRRIQITDPCDEPTDWENHVNLYGDAATNVLPGKYVCKKVVVHEVRLYYDRFFRLEVRHQDYPDVQANEFFTIIYVASGQCGVFDDEYYRKNYADNDGHNPQSWYHKVSSLTVVKPYWGTLDGKCVNSSTCNGDGRFGVYVGRNQDGEVVSIRIDLIESN